MTQVFAPNQFKRALFRTIALPVLLTLLATVGMGILSWQLFAALTWTEHSAAILLRNQSTEKLMIEMQSTVRGYELSGNPAYLTYYDKARAELDDTLASLAQLIAENPAETKQFQALVKAKDDWVIYAQKAIEKRKQGTLPDETALQLDHEMIVNLRGQLRIFEENELILQKERLSRLHLLKGSYIILAPLLFTALALILGLYARRQLIFLAASYEKTLKVLHDQNEDLRRSEEQLKEQKEWFRVTLSSIGDGVIVTDKDGRIVFMNEESLRLTGWLFSEAFLKPLAVVFRILHEETRESVEDPVMRVFRERRVIGLESNTLLLSRTGQECPIEDSAAPIYDDKGKILGVVLVFHDATTLRLSQKTLRNYSTQLEEKVAERTTTLQRSMAEMEAFSYTVSHDLRSPLRAMQGYAVAVLEDYGDKLEEEGRHYLIRIQNAADRLDKLIKDLLDYTRVIRANQPLVDIALDRLVRDISEQYPNLQPPMVQITIKDTLPVVRGTESALTQIFSNLLSNAAKFVIPGQVASILVRWEDVSSKLVRLWVEDSGIGISELDQEKIFKMFVQINHGKLYEGTGVGLAIVKKAAESIQGNVGVESTPGQGSRFWVELIKA